MPFAAAGWPVQKAAWRHIGRWFPPSEWSAPGTGPESMRCGHLPKMWSLPPPHRKGTETLLQGRSGQVKMDRDWSEKAGGTGDVGVGLDY